MPQHFQPALRKLPLLAVLIVFMLMTTCIIIHICAEPTDKQIMAGLTYTFNLVLEVEKAGGQVEELVSALNQALTFLAEAASSTDPDNAAQLVADAEKLLDDVIVQAPEKLQQGLISQRDAKIMLVAELSILTFLAIIVYIYGPRLFWGLWLRTHGSWRAKST